MNITPIRNTRFYWTEDYAFKKTVDLSGYKHTTQVPGDGNAIACPQIPQCTFIGVYNDSDGDCWCVYQCPEGLLFKRCT